MRREDAIGAIADELVGVKGDPFDITIERSEAEPIAERVLDALAPYVVLRDQMEQVGWRCDQIVGPKRWLVCPHSAPCGPVFVFREVPDAV